MFYNGVDAYSKSGLDGVAGGALMNRTYEDAYQMKANMIMYSCQWLNKRFTYSWRPSTAKAIHEEDKYQQILDELNRFESSSQRPMMNEAGRTIVLSNPNDPTQEENKGDVDDLYEETPYGDDAEVRPETVAQSVVESEVE
ncbi:hypothetical protein EPI10_000490 [Gossypium australe]|uniref:Uncharacterized protein n=1 Tax=Gossypium australe TaxID=47621 RepID=A0A5B6V800_9ROSI|nr:hypothetical protein EPI10_000490 [Gossypium australe]